MFKGKTVFYQANTVATDMVTFANASTVTMIQACNRSSSQVTITVSYYSNAASTYYSMTNYLTIPAYSTLPLITDKLFANPGDKLRVNDSTSNTTFMLSYVENPQ